MQWKRLVKRENNYWVRKKDYIKTYHGNLLKLYVKRTIEDEDTNITACSAVLDNADCIMDEYEMTEGELFKLDNWISSECNDDENKIN